MKNAAALVLLALLPTVSLAKEKTEKTEPSPYDTPERVVAASPGGAVSLALEAGESVVDYEVSPAGGLVALEVKSASGHDVRFWRMGEGTAPVAWKAPAGTTLKGLTWHPAKEKTLFLLSASASGHRILRFEEKGGAWATTVLLKSPTTLRRIVIGPRPSLYSTPKGELVTEFRLYYGAALGGGAWSTRSVTESGVRDVQIAGPNATMDTVAGEGEYPSSVEAASALPLGFHPAGDRLLFEEPGKRFREARFTGGWSEEEKPFFGGKLSGGTATWLANGLGLVHWTAGVPGVELVFASQVEPRRVAAEWTFAGTPGNVPDGRGLVGLTKEADGRQTLRFVPAQIPLGNVANAWMFVEGKDDADRLARHGGLFRPSDAEQLHSVYDAELYGGRFLDRPLVVTTDVFWEDFAAAFQGLFILRERVQAIPAFWEFVKGARAALSGPGGSKVWGPVFAAAAELEAPAGTAKPATGIGPEAARILALKRADSPVVGPGFPYGEMKPRGNYAATPRMRSYFMAFRYLTEVARREVERHSPAERARALADLASLPPAVKAKAGVWIAAYEPFLAPGRAPVVFDDKPFAPPPYASRPADGPGLFPLSFGFDNEVFLTTVFHESWPGPEQIQDPGNRRLLPSGLDLAAASGSAFARTLLSDELKLYPNLGGALDRLGEKWRRNRPAFARSPSLYHRWLDALAVQWAEEALAGAVDGRELWRAKRLQTGLASFTTLRHTTVLVNERMAAEAGEGGWEEIVPRPPRGWVEADPASFEAIAALFDAAAVLVRDEKIRLDGMVPGSEEIEGRAEPLRQGILRRLAEVAAKARLFAGMARKELAGAPLSPSDYDEIAHVGRVAEHNFLVFKSLANERLGISNPDPLPKVVDVAGGGDGTGYLLMGVGKPLVWDLLVPYYGRREVVRGPVYAWYEVHSESLLDDDEWRQDLDRQKRPAWVAPFIGRSTERGER
ncbi:MAG: DUF3160 domain-containing protein [Holophagales bacterium]|nr:DUF3160 domain-containing protein [Holophagales bacterium]